MAGSKEVTVVRPQGSSRVRTRHLGSVALAFATTLPLAAIAVAAPTEPAGTGAPAAAPVPAAPTARVQDRRLRYGQPVVVRGRVSPAARGGTVALEHAAAGRRWRRSGAATVRPDGRYRLRAKLHHSGAVRVVAADARAAAAATHDASRAHHVTVAARLRVARSGYDVRAGGAVRVRGVRFPRERGARVTLQARRAGRWRTIGGARTDDRGGFAVRVVARAVGTVRLRVLAVGTRRNAAATAAAGSLSGYRPSVASWYALYGNRTACGQVLGSGTLGVAHRTLPCGTRVSIRYRGREVTVPVIDRGPFSPGREWDLTGATARALGFGGVGTVWTTA